MGGKPSKTTPADHRLKENQGRPSPAKGAAPAFKPPFPGARPPFKPKGKS